MIAPRKTPVHSPGNIPSPWLALANLSTFWTGVLALAAGTFLNYRECDPLDFFGFLLISIASLLPSYLWCARRVFGMPIFPLYALSNIWAFALPLVSGHPIVIIYPVTNRFTAALTVVASLLVGTFVWYAFTNRLVPPRAKCLALDEGRSEFLFFTTIVVSVIFNLFLSQINRVLPVIILSLIQLISLALTSLALFVLAYRLGSKQLRASYQRLFILLFICLIISSLPSLYLITTASYAILATSGYILGKGKIPWLSLSFFIVALSFLHLGKAEMRDKYWTEDGHLIVTPLKYPAFFAEWFDKSLKNISPSQGSLAEGPIVEDHETFVTRSSLIHILLLEQSMTPSSLPFLDGQTYELIPQLLLPRFLNAKKYSTTIGTDILAAYYGLIDTNQPLNTTIGFGLLNESYANFGYTGCIMFGLFTGVFYGFAARLSATYPLLSMRSLLGIVVLAMSFQDEFTSTMYVCAIFQSFVLLTFVGFLFMRRIPVDSFRPKVSPSSPFIK